MQVLILGGGRGMRLEQATDEAPPALLYLPGGTILDYVLHHLAQLPATDVAMVLQYRGDQVAGHLGHDSGITLIPQEAPFTLGGALASAADWVRGPVVVIHVNHYFARPIRALFDNSTPELPLFVVSEAALTKGSADASGAYRLPPRAFELLAADPEPDQPQALFERLVAQDAFPSPQRIAAGGWSHPIQNAAALLAVNRHLMCQWHDTLHPLAAGGAYDAMNLNWISPAAEIDSPVPGLFVTVGPGASIRDCQLFNAIVMPGVHLEGVRESQVVFARVGGSRVHLYGGNGR